MSGNSASSFATKASSLRPELVELGGVTGD